VATKVKDKPLSLFRVYVLLIWMTSFRMKKIGLALFLMMSLLIGHASACTCPHHVENKPAEPDCHSHHPSTEMVEARGDGNVCDAECVCSVDQRSPSVASKAPSKEFKANDKPVQSEQVVPNIEVVALASSSGSLPTFDTNLSCSTTLKSLLPSRAPPRL
jgi:hypothetical protein